MSGAFVVETIQLQHLNQQLLFWRDETFGILETVGCYAKGIAGALQPPYALVTNTVKTRRHITAIRFRLYDGIEANIGLRWETPAARCGGNVLEPDPKQGQPIRPNNGSADPGTRPPQQGDFDPADKSDNDGDYDPNSPLPPPPTASGGSANACWHIIMVGVHNRCEGDPIVYDYPFLPDPSQEPVWVPGPQNSACPNAKDGAVTFNGVVVNNPTGVVGTPTFAFY
jgi:hypothetical protein